MLSTSDFQALTSLITAFLFGTHKTKLKKIQKVRLSCTKLKKTKTECQKKEQI